MTLFNKNKILAKVVQYVDNLSGTSARRFKYDLEALRRSKNLGSEGVPQSTIDHVYGLANDAADRSFSARLNTGLGVGVGGTAGFLGLHKYHQHKDDKIMARIDKMYYN
jgi:hypothetical protein